MLNLEPIDHIALHGVNKLVVDAVSRDGDYNSSLYDDTGNPIDIETKLLKRVYDGKGIYSIVYASIDALVGSREYSVKGTESLLKAREVARNWSPEEVLANLEKELETVTDYDPDYKLTMEVYVVRSVLNKNVVSSMSKGRYTDPHTSASSFTPDSNKDIDAGDYSDEYAMFKTGLYENVFFEPGDSMDDEYQMRKAREELVRHLDVVYHLTKEYTSKTDTASAADIFKYAQQCLIESYISEAVKEVESRVGAITSTQKPDEREFKLFASAITNDGEAGSYHARKSLNKVFSSYSELGDRAPYYTAMTGIARCCETLGIPFPMIDTRKVLEPGYISKLYSALSSTFTANLTTYDLKKFNATENIVDAFRVSVRKRQEALRKSSSKIPAHKEHQFITPEVREAVRSLRIEDMGLFESYVVETAERGIEVWIQGNKDKKKESDILSATTNKGQLVSSSPVHEKNRKDLKRNSVSYYSYEDKSGIKIKKGPAHPDTVSLTDRIIEKFKRDQLAKRGPEFIDELSSSSLLVVDAIKNMFGNDELRFQHRFLYNATKGQYETIDVKEHPFNQGDKEPFCDYLIRDDGFMVANYISLKQKGTKMVPIFNKAEEFGGLQIVTALGKMIYPRCEL